jgi:hypothetical protein
MCIHGGTASHHIAQRARSTRPDGPSTGVPSAALLGELPLPLSPGISAWVWPTSMHRRALANPPKRHT